MDRTFVFYANTRTHTCDVNITKKIKSLLLNKSKKRKFDVSRYIDVMENFP